MKYGGDFDDWFQLLNKKKLWWLLWLSAVELIQKTVKYGSDCFGWLSAVELIKVS